MSRTEERGREVLSALAEPDDTSTMGIRVEFEGGPADGTVQEYPEIGIALPSLYWSRDEPQRVSATYRRLSSEPDPVTGRWRYGVVAG